MSKLGLACYNEKIPIQDANTRRYLVLGTYKTQDPELYNIARAYIH